MIEKETARIKHYQFPILSGYSDIWHGVFTRHGGVSPPPFQSLNISFNLGDKSTHVVDNRGLISEVIGGFPVTYAHQNHGTEILVFKRKDKTGIPIAEHESTAGDALVTDIPGRFLAVQTADCQSVLLFDPNRRVVANVHSGWRGSIRNIIGRTVDTMAAAFGCRASHLIAGIGPSLGPCCAEFVNYQKEIPKRFWKYRNPENLFDFWSISKDQLKGAGVLPEHVAFSRICTKCRTDRYFSYRGEGVTGRFASVIGIIPDPDTPID